MRTTISLTLLCLLLLTSCKNIKDLDAVIVLGSDQPTTEKSSNNMPPAHAPAHGRRAKNGPPSHAPAHGYRHQQEGGQELAFDSGLGVYVVINHAGVYFDNGIYLRFFNDHWIAAVQFDGPWGKAEESQIPDTLKKEAKKYNNTKGKDRGKENRGKKN